ncbi:glycoside hydrolase [Achlya hypogyna]|uniref:Glycoside hydrolase n=1 Tax=Achlya hypogyna TaxID=1202772 RepID=A0A1V9Z3W1_ACHHY|nr:glycoside hydrolase [Achlya hypogyna]
MRGMLRWAVALVAAALVAEAGKLNPIIVRGNKMYDSKTGTRFFMRGITYDYDVSDDHYNEWSKVAITTALAPIMGSFNTLRIYNVNPDKTYDQFMEHMDSIGVYVLISASPANVDYFGSYRYATITKSWGPDGAAVDGALQKDQTKTCYPALLLYFGKAIIKDFAKYDNTLGVLVANEILQYDLTAAACVKAYVSDLKNWMRVNVQKMRILPLAYAGADSAPKASPDLTAAAKAYQPDQYTVLKIMGLLCGDTMVNGVMQTSIDMYLVNEYRWCNDGTYATYEIFQKMAQGVPIVMGFGETGCDTLRPRKWTNVPYLFSSSTASKGFTDIFSGGYAYTFGSASLGSDTGYPLFTGGGKDIVSKPGTTPTADFTNLVAMFKANPSDVQKATFTQSDVCSWTPPSPGTPVTPLAAASGWLTTCTNPALLIKPTDKWTTNTRQGATCTKLGATCEVTVSSKLGTSEEDICGKVLEVVSGGGTCTPGSNSCGKYGQCTASADGKSSSCVCLGCWSGLSCSVLDESKCSQLSSDKDAPKYIFTGVGIFLGVMTLVFGGLGIVAGKKSQELKQAEKLAANQATSI